MNLIRILFTKRRKEKRKLVEFVVENKNLLILALVQVFISHESESFCFFTNPHLNWVRNNKRKINNIF